jgi:16S rRNA (uracil1498-N3)-methyltransferase
MSNRFYTPDSLSPGEFGLSGAEAHHLVSVRRFSPGDRIILFNGNGLEYTAELVDASRKQAVLNVLSEEAVNRELPGELTIAAAMPKGDRGDFLIEKLVELGVTRFVPLHTERTIVQPKESRLERLSQAVIEASKQCGRNVLMRIGALTRWTDFVRTEAAGFRAVLHPDGNAVAVGSGSPCVVAVGPEGGFTDQEVQLAVAAGWEKLAMGPRILRVETAAIAAACQFAGQ